MNDKEREILTVHAHAHDLETQVKELEHLKGLESTLHSQKWEEFSRLAENMKHLSREIAQKNLTARSMRSGKDDGDDDDQARPSRQKNNE